MRRRITRALVAAAAAGATLTAFGLAAAGTASAATAMPAASTQYGNGSPIATESTAGYEASGRYFRYVQALITVPDIKHFTKFFPEEYVQLSNGSLNSVGDPTGDQYTRAGIMPCTVYKNMTNSTITCSTPWIAFIDAFNNSIMHGPYYTHFIPLNVNPGDGVLFSIYYYQGGNELHFAIKLPDGDALYYKTQAYGPIFDHAAALDDFVNTGGNPITLPPWANQFRINQFLQGAMTTYIGNRGSFVGPWTTSLVEATSNEEVYPYGHVRVSPGYLWGDGMTANGAVRWGDAFGVWART